MYIDLKARDVSINPISTLEKKFSSLVSDTSKCDAIYSDSTFENVLGVCGLPFKAPVMLELLKDEKIAMEFINLIKEKSSLLIVLKTKNSFTAYLNRNGKINQVELSEYGKRKIKNITKEIQNWAGSLNSEGEHIINLKNPSPGPHFYVNLLMGNRIEFPYSLQTTPKSVVDFLGGGSFRSHADFQVLATRWDFRQEENGFPANRQFYLVENGKKIFYSGNVNDPNFKSGYCVHSQNITTITVMTKCGLKIVRKIFILPQYKGLPLATEVQRIEIYNETNKKRDLKIITVGMFGSSAPHALMEDVLYSNIIMQSRILEDRDKNIVAIGVDYYPVYAKDDERFHSILIREKNKNNFAKEFCSNYNEFVGKGTLENPEGVLQLSNRISRKGPGFFALAGYFHLEAGESKIIDTFTGVVSKRVNKDSYYVDEISSLLKKFDKPETLDEVISDIKSFNKKFSSFLQINTKDKEFNTYFNNNLPFQILYQTFVSRSFCQTQKGYREIGFREIQDLYASMYYFVGMGKSDLVKRLLKEWASKVFELGYAYHNFFWRGKEPGKWSDDSLWFVQAVYKYVNLTKDINFLKEETEIAGKENKETRPIYKTIEAIIDYSAYISVGKHGLPLLDRADWNDCLRIDTDSIDGPEKERLYKKRVEECKNKNISFDDENTFSESVMNACLLKVAIDEYSELALLMKNYESANRMKNLSKEIHSRVQKYAWKEDFFARVLYNRSEKFKYIGAKGDNLGKEPGINDSYFINSYSWPIISEIASEEQIRIMTDTLEKTLKTEYGFRLMTLAALEKICKEIAIGEYFPGDRENGAVFKHASMMMVFAMFKAAKTVNDKKLAERLTKLAYWMIDIVLPYKTMKDPFKLAGNPRFCTQYINSETGEHIGPLLSGTATWLNLSLVYSLGVDFTVEGIRFNPILRPEEKEITYTMKIENTTYNITIQKPEGFYRIKDNSYKIFLDNKEIDNNLIPIFNDGKNHIVVIKF